MAKERNESAAVARLRRQAEHAMQRSRRAEAVLPLLEQLAALAPAGGEAWRFAQRSLVQLQLPTHPWRAALAARRLLRYEPDAADLHGVLGLCHSLLGNYQAAVAAYRRALDLEPGNPYHHHNLGHLLDAALDRPQQALPHLLLAWREQPDEHEIAASLAHCLGRLGDYETALALVEDALQAAPRHEGHRELLQWLRTQRRRLGAAPGARAPAARGGDGAEGAMRAAGRPPRQDAREAVVWLLEHGDYDGPGMIERARMAIEIWRAYLERVPEPRVRRPEAVAAGLEAAADLVLGYRTTSLAEVARRHQVSRRTVYRWRDEVARVLGMVEHDRRFWPPPRRPT